MLKKILISCLFCSLGTIPMSALAVSLGNSTVLSNLGEPIIAEIEILQWQDTDLTSLDVELASEATFDSFGLDYLPVLSDLSLTIPSPENGELKVLVTSQSQMEEPFLEVLLLLRWPGGGVSREYVLLFDPPAVVVTSRALIPRVVRVLPPMETSEIEANVRAEPEIVRTQLTPRPNVIQAPRDNSQQLEELIEEEVEEPLVIEAQISRIIIERRQYLIQENDSLSDIALRFQLDENNESLYQMLLGIFNLNPSAFNEGNITALQVGQEIIIPGSDDIDNIAPLTAERVYGELLAEGQVNLRLEGERLAAERLAEELREAEQLAEEQLAEELQEAERLEEELLVSNILPANISPEEARFVAEPIPETIEEESVPEAQDMDQNPVQEATQTGVLASTSTGTVLVPSSEVNSSAALETEVSTLIEAPDTGNLSPFQALRQNREQQRQALENRVNGLKQQIIEVQTVTLRLSNVVNVENEKKAEQQKLVNIVASILMLIAFLLTIGISIYVFRGSKR